MKSCPFGAIVKRSGILSVGKMLLNGEKIVAMIAPAIEGQLPGSLEQIKAAMKEAGFTEVVEVAEGAKITAEKEARELAERTAEGKGFLATSCCPAWFTLVDKHIPKLKDHISTTLSPMGYTSYLCRERFPGYKVVFVGPCVAKRYEAATRYPDTIDRVISYSELSAIFAAKDIDVSAIPADWDDETCSAFSDCRNFAVSGGVAGCVLSRVEERDRYKVLSINGIDAKVVRTMKLWPQLPPDADLVEIMCCPGGCIAGPGTMVTPQAAMKARQNYQKMRVEAKKKKEEESQK